MANIYDVQITVIKIKKGHCFAGHKVGDTWLCRRDKTPEGMCVGAFKVIIPTLRTLIQGGMHYWDKKSHPKGDLSYVSCVDPHVQVEFELRRIRPEKDS